MARPFFNIDRISHFDIFDRHAETTIAVMKDRFRVGLAVDFQVRLPNCTLLMLYIPAYQDVVSRFTLDSASEFLFGHCIDTLAAELPYPFNISISDLGMAPTSSNKTLDFGAAFTAAQYALAMRNSIGATWPLFEFFRDPTREPMKVVDLFLKPILKDAIEKHEASQEFSNAEKEFEDETLLDHLVRQTTGMELSGIASIPSQTSP